MSAAWVDLRDDAKYRLVIPPLPKNRYLSVAILDMWTDVLKVVSSRTVANHGQHKVILIGPSGVINKGEEDAVVKSPTDVVWILVRIGAKGDEDISQVSALQKKIRLIRLAGSDKNGASACSLNDAQKKLLQDPRMQEIKKAADEKMEQVLFDSHTLFPGWSSNLNHNNIDAILRRAAIAFDGLAALPSSEAVYFTSAVDSNGQQLSGNNCYIVHFDKTPPADAFWSLSAYDKKTALFEKNSIDRYSIGSSTSGLHYNANGSFDIILTHEQPEKCAAKEPFNWLPLPAQDCFIVLRLYHPRKEVLDLNYRPPKVEKIK